MNVEHVVFDHFLAHSARAFGQIEAPLVQPRPDGRAPEAALPRQLDLRLHPLVVDDVLQVKLRLPELLELKRKIPR